MSGLGAYRKTVAAVITALLTWALPALVLTHGHVSGESWYALAVALAGAFGVYAVTNDGQPKPDPAPQPAPVELTAAGSVPLEHTGLARKPRGVPGAGQFDRPTRNSGG